MKFSCEKWTLNQAVSTASRAAAAKSSVPAMEGLLIEAGEFITVTGYDLKTGIRVKTPADVVEPGSIVFNSRLFSDIIRKLPDDVVNVESDDRLMTTISCGMSVFHIVGISPEDFPELPPVENISSMELPQKLLKTMISQTNFAVSDNEARPIHTGALFEVENCSLTVVAVDGFRLALRREEVGTEPDFKAKFVVPGLALAEVERILSDSEDKVRVTVGEKHVTFTMGDVLLVSRRLEGEFLNYKEAIPRTGKFTVEVVPAELARTVDRVSLIITDKLKSPVRCLFGDGVLSLSSVTALGKASDECGIDGDGGDLEIGFNNRYMLDALKAVPADKVKMQLNSPISPCVILPVDDSDNFLYMILPVRLRQSHEN
ncbi:MAG: DNA polymerase III subunit beta [Oscillospiraceae bacterium]|nr:DNA polymerase III subunit beta [Oscillospiraceae bacterium]